MLSFGMALEFIRLDRILLAQKYFRLYPLSFPFLLQHCQLMLTCALQDMFIIATSSCASYLPSRRGYSPLSISANGNPNERGRNSGPEDENRLIDQLDEEWDD
jgi:hypothetical protein